MMEHKETTAQQKQIRRGKWLDEYTPERRREIAKSGQAAGVKARNKRRAARDVLLDILASDSTDKDLRDKLGAKGVDGTELAALLMSMTGRAHKSAQMAELIFRLTGDLQEQPQQNITIVNQLSDADLMAERQRLINGQGMINITPEPPEIE